jgi:adenylate kinase
MSESSPQAKKKVKKSSNFSTKRSLPNILVTGTPGVGKTTLCQKLCQKVDKLRHINVGEFAKENNCLEEWDEELKCHVLNEDKIVDDLEDAVAAGGVVVDHHVTDFFPERWFDIVFVLRTDNTVLYDRLTARGYEGKKLDNNMECEIFQTILVSVL